MNGNSFEFKFCYVIVVHNHCIKFYIYVLLFKFRVLKPKDELYTWTDVTSEFLSSCEELELGELLHDPRFAVQEEVKARAHCLSIPALVSSKRCRQSK